jgi:hypothetical protein
MPTEYRAEVVQAVLERDAFIVRPADVQRPGATWGRRGGPTWNGRRISRRDTRWREFVVAGANPILIQNDESVGRKFSAWAIVLRWGMDSYAPGLRQELADRLLRFDGARRYIGTDEWGARGTVIAIPKTRGSRQEVEALFRMVSAELQRHGLRTEPAAETMGLTQHPATPADENEPLPAAPEEAADGAVSHTPRRGAFGQALVDAITEQRGARQRRRAAGQRRPRRPRRVE